MIISVSHLSKKYKVVQKEPGISGTLQSFFNRKYKEVKAIEDISFSLNTGELVGFIGPNGAGKTTTLKSLSGLLYPSHGDISVLGYSPFKREPAFLKSISLVMGQKNQLWWDLPATDTFLLNKEIYEISDDEYKKTVGELIELLAVSDVLDTPVRKLSLGQRMKMELIAALIHKPKVLFLDEPTIGLDVVMQKTLRDFIKIYNEKYQSTILLTSHYMQDVKELCKRVIIIDSGQILFDGLLEHIVKKFSTHKDLLLEFENPISENELKQFGTIKSFQFPFATISVPLDKSNAVAAQLLQNYSLADLNIEEPALEDIIRTVFSEKDKIVDNQ